MKILYTALFLSFNLMINAQNKEVYKNIESIVAETQKIVSVKPGHKIDTAYFKTLFLPTANFTVVGEEEGKSLYETMSLNDFLDTLSDEYYAKGFTEVGKGHIVEQYKGIAHVIQSFYGEDSDGEKGWGVNSYQLIFSDDRWWIANMVWTMSDQDGKDIPKKYLEN